MNDSTTTPSYQQESIPVEGGELCVARWGSSGPVILAIHGITASHREFLALADSLGEHYQLIAPDLRGRGQSRDITGPWGMRAHAADMIAILDHFNIKTADIVLGHSMGGFVAAVMGAQYPERCGRFVFVDGGIPIMAALPLHRLPFGNWLIEKLIGKILGPALKRLDMHFESLATYRDFWREHAALKDDWSHYIEDYLAYDLVGEEPFLRPSASKSALLDDVRTQLFENLVPESLKNLSAPVRFLRAPRGLMNDKPLYPPQKLAKFSSGVREFSSIDIADSNHYTILLSAHGAHAVADEVRHLLNSV